MLMGHLEVIEKEKEILTSKLPSLTRSTSDDDLLSTDDGSLDDVDTGGKKLHSSGTVPCTILFFPLDGEKYKLLINF